MKRVALRLSLLLAFTLLSNRAFAAPIVWTLQNVTFDDATPLTGSFTYDAVIDTYSNWNLTVQPGGIFTAYNYLPVVDGGFVGLHSAVMADFVAFPAPPGRYVRLNFVNPLTDLGGTINLLTAGNVSWECNNCGTNRFIISGSVTSTPAAVPEPATLTLFGSGLAAAGLRRWRRRRQIS
jgi:hypothetical protein